MRTRSSLRRLTSRSAVTTTALTVVLLALTVLVLGGIWQTREAAGRQAEALGVARTLQEVQVDVSVQMLYMRQYRVEPSTPVRDRYADAADSAESTLRELTSSSVAGVATDARALLDRQGSYREVADLLMRAVSTGGTEDARQLDLTWVTPAFYTLQQSVDDITEKYRSRAEGQLAAIQVQLTRTVAVTGAGLAITVLLLSLIFRSVLGQQRSLTRVARENEELALRDALTGLANRAALVRHLARLEARLAAEPDSLAAALVIDLDGFKGINDSLGHQAGDDLLRISARRLAALVRDGDMVARTGGDEFVVLLSELRSRADAEAVAARAVAALRNPVDLDGQRVVIGASVGVAVAPEDAGCAALLHSADHAMYRAKKAGGGVAVFEPTVDGSWSAEATRQRELAQLLDEGDPDHQIEVHYQPQLDLTRLQVTGMEALVRWRHPEQGLLPPAVVVPMVDRSGGDLVLTALVLDRAVAQGATWAAQGLRWKVAVNVSPTSLSLPGFPVLVRDVLAAHALPGELLRIELVETSAVTNADRCASSVAELRAAGVMVSLDDFGTGFSSLSHLNTLAVDELKVDREFVAELSRSGEDRVLRLAARIGTEMGLRVVAEGVEDLGLLDRLRELGCTDAQGYALGRPVPADEVGGVVADLLARLAPATITR